MLAILRNRTYRHLFAAQVIALRIPRKMGIDSTASWAAIPDLGQVGRPLHGVRPEPLGQAVSNWRRVFSCSLR